MLALDTNVLARYFVQEARPSRATLAQAEAARRVIEGGGDLFVAKTVLLELEWVLRGVYGLARQDILEAFGRLLAIPAVEVEDRPSVETAIANLHAGLDFADALHHASSRSCTAFLSFDTRRFAGKAKRMSLTPPVRVPA